MDLKFKAIFKKFTIDWGLE